MRFAKKFLSNDWYAYIETEAEDAETLMSWLQQGEGQNKSTRRKP